MRRFHKENKAEVYGRTCRLAEWLAQLRSERTRTAKVVIVMWLTKKVKMLPGGEPIVPLWQFLLRWLLVIVLAPIVVPLLVILYPIGLLQRYMQKRDARRKEMIAAQKKEKFKRDVIVTPVSIDHAIFDIERTSEYESFCKSVSSMMDEERDKRGNRTVAMTREMRETWKKLAAKFPHLKLPESVSVTIHSKFAGAEVHLHLLGKDVIGDASAESFAERVMLRHVSDQMYRAWHARYGVETIYNTRSQLNGVKSPGRISRDTMLRVDAFNFMPTVGALADGRIACEYVVHHPHGDEAGILRYRAVEDDKEPFGVFRAVVEKISISSSFHF